MDATALLAIISALAGGVAGEAGKSAWASLAALVRRRFGDSEELAVLEGATAESAPRAVDVLISRAEADPAFERELTSWMAEAGATVQIRRDVTNTISGDARIQGNVIQAGDIHGPIDFGGRG